MTTAGIAPPPPPQTRAADAPRSIEPAHARPGGRPASSPDEFRTMLGAAVAGAAGRAENGASRNSGAAPTATGEPAPPVSLDGADTGRRAMAADADDDGPDAPVIAPLAVPTDAAAGEAAGEAVTPAAAPRPVSPDPSLVDARAPAVMAAPMPGAGTARGAAPSATETGAGAPARPVTDGTVASAAQIARPESRLVHAAPLRKDAAPAGPALGADAAVQDPAPREVEARGARPHALTPLWPQAAQPSAEARAAEAIGRGFVASLLRGHGGTAETPALGRAVEVQQALLGVSDAGSAGATPTLPGAGAAVTASTGGDASMVRTMQAMHTLISARGGTMTFSLEPAELGRVEVRLAIRGGVVRVDLLAHAREGAERLSGQMHTLRQALESQGLSVERLAVHVRAESSTADDRGGQRHASHGGSDSGRDRDAAGEQSRGRHDREQERWSGRTDGKTDGERTPPSFSMSAIRGAGHT